MAGALQQVSDEDEPIANINIIPFVDIVLVLLIIFLLTANLIAKESIPVELPRAANASETVDPTINIVITAAGELFLDGTAITAEVLRARIAEQHRADPRLRAVIAADRGVRYERVVQVIDLLKDAGIVSFALNIERAPRP